MYSSGFAEFFILLSMVRILGCVVYFLLKKKSLKLIKKFKKNK